MLLRKMRRDLALGKVQFLSIFLMSFLGIFVFAGLDSEANGMDHYEAVYYEKTNLADLWIMGKTFKDYDLKKILSVPDVINAEKRLQTDGKAILSEELDLQMNFIDSNDISKMLIVKGNPYTPGQAGVWIDYKLSEVQNLKVGDMLHMKVDGIEFEEEIKGTFYDPEYVYFLPDAAAMMPDYGSYGAAFMDASRYPDAARLHYNQIIADVNGVDNTGGLNDEEKERCRRIENAITSLLDSSSIVVTDKDASLSYQTYRAEIEQHQSMVYLFPLVFLLIAVLGIITTMTRMTSRQRIQIGTLKALGLSKKTITIHYASYSFFLSLFGGIAGAVLGYNTIADLILSMEGTTYLVPDLDNVFTVRALGGIIVSVIVSTLVSIIACRKELMPPPAETLRPASPKNLKHTWIEKSSLWMKLDFATQWNIRDILRNKVRSAMGVLGVLGCSMLLFGAFACLDTMDFITTWMYGELNTASYQIIMEPETPLSLTEEYAKKYKGQMVGTSGIEMEAGGIKKSGTATVYDTGNYLHFEDKDMKSMHRKKDGVSMSYKMAESLGIGRGDMFKWHVIGDDNWHMSRVSDIYRNPSSQGITMTREVFEGYEQDFRPDAIYTNVNAKKELADDDHITGVQGTAEMMKALDAMKEMMYMMVYILVAAAAVLGVVVLYNLGVLSIVEKHREMATLKVLGFTTSKIRRILQDQNIWLTVIGIALGIPCGMGLINALFATMPESMDYIATYRLPSYLYTIIGTFTLSLLVNRMLSKKVKTIDMVDALKGQE